MRKQSKLYPFPILNFYEKVREKRDPHPPQPPLSLSSCLRSLPKTSQRGKSLFTVDFHFPFETTQKNPPHRRRGGSKKRSNNHPPSTRAIQEQSASPCYVPFLSAYFPPFETVREEERRGDRGIAIHTPLQRKKVPPFPSPPLPSPLSSLPPFRLHSPLCPWIHQWPLFFPQKIPQFPHSHSLSLSLSGHTLRPNP